MSFLSVQDSHAYKQMDVTKDLISLIFVFKVMSLSFHTVDNLVKAAVACAILHTTSFFEPSTVLVAHLFRNL